MPTNVSGTYSGPLRHLFRRPVILLSGYGTAITDGIKFPPDAVLGKPLSLDELRTVIGQIYTDRMAI